MPLRTSRSSGGWPLIETPDIQNFAEFFEQGIHMRKLAIAAALLTISAAAHAGTYNVEGVTIHVQDGCRSSSCVSVYAPDYGYYHGGGAPRVHRAHKDSSRFASVTRKEDAAPAAAASDAAAPITEATPAKIPETAPAAASQATPVDTAPAK
jgi:hypothetical protein